MLDSNAFRVARNAWAPHAYASVIFRCQARISASMSVRHRGNCIMPKPFYIDEVLPAVDAMIGPPGSGGDANVE
jgi:hypothetical protein